MRHTFGYQLLVVRLDGAGTSKALLTHHLTFIGLAQPHSCEVRARHHECDRLACGVPGEFERRCHVVSCQI